MTMPLPNDDPDVDPEEIVAATDETPTIATEPEVSETTQALTQWDESPASTGSMAPVVRPEDDIPAAEILFREGLDEADRDRRIAAVDPDFQP